MDTSVDAELDRLINRRASEDRRPDPTELDDGYVASVRRYNARRRAEARALWHAFHLEQAARIERTAAQLAAGHREKAAELAVNENGGVWES
ncbi:MAG: hypothetical protein M3R38_12730 [Actinomycetota bacterium]|nr:hypothetical protein [Actinomycetota bacterium]